MAAGQTEQKLSRLSQERSGSPMKSKMSPLQIGLAWGFPIGLVMALTSVLAGSLSGSSIVVGGLDVVFAFFFGLILFGGVAAFVQWRRIANSMGDVAPPGWYDSPEADGTQWFWTGTKWSEMTRPVPPRTQERKF